MEIAVVVCDLCRQVGKPTTRYAVVSGGRMVETDLCLDDARPLEALLDHSTNPPPTKRAARQPVARAAKKAPAKKAPAKKAPAKKDAASKPPVAPAARMMTLDEIEALKK